MSDFGTLVDNVGARIGDPGHAEFETEIKQAIIDAIDFYRTERFWFTEDRYVQESAISVTTAASTEYYDLPSSPQVYVIETVKLDSGGVDLWTLVEMAWNVIDDWSVAASTYSGLPTHYAVRGDQIRFYPIPDAAYTVYITGIVQPATALTTASGDSATNVWCTDGRLLIEARAAKFMARNPLRDDQLEAVCHRDEMDALRRLKTETNRRLKTGRILAHGPGHRRWARR